MSSSITMSERVVGSAFEYIDSYYDKLVDNFRSASDVMEIGDIIMVNANEAEGTEAIVEADKQLEAIVEVTNRFKTFMSTDIANLMTKCAENLRDTDQTAGDNMGVQG
ncbi:hypothetical protein SAMN05660668_02442 [Pseudobutyrivibrio sp. AR14]|uniref:hypothetical protein n=1 Tax=Pseudobutyrivibrio sp. AR14 TaxID=1520804 RepID=UPI0008861A8D|nr:hypothetical protein [Pseudobutyrivibrio sp. AR14]SCY38353.1 hypothetical protein SAMN05660668_02442 [Pseudobutyrivibrio sp. AR14]